MDKIASDVYLFSQPDSAFYFAELEYKMAKTTGNKKQMAAALNIQGISFAIRGNYVQAILLFRKNIKINEELGDARGIAASQNNIGLIYKEQGNYIQALDYLEKSIKTQRKSKHSKGIANALMNIGNIYGAQNNHEKALEYLKKSLHIHKEVEYLNGIANASMNIGIVYKNQGKIEKAQFYFQNSLMLSKKTGDKMGLTNSYLNLGKFFFDQKKYPEVLEYGKKALTLAQQMGVVVQIKGTSELLYKVYKTTNQPTKALEMYELHIKMRDSIINKENTRALVQQEYKYKYEKEQSTAAAQHHKKMALSEERKKRQEILSYGSLLGTIMILIFSFAIHKRFKQTNEQKIIIQKQNKHITESITYAKRIQEASLTSMNYMNNIFNEYFIFFQPKDIVSGDFYWAYQINKNQIMVAVCDCTGHGVPGAFMSMISISLLNEVIIDNGHTEVNKVLDNMSSMLIKRLHQKGENVKTRDGLAISLLLIDKKKKIIEFAGASHKLYLAGNKGCKEVKGNHQSVGYLFGREKPFSKTKVHLEKDETIYLCSDGFTDQFGGKNRKKYGRHLFIDLLETIKENPIPEQKTILEKTFTEWKGDIDQIDDILVMGIRI